MPSRKKERKMEVHTTNWFKHPLLSCCKMSASASSKQRALQMASVCGYESVQDRSILVTVFKVPNKWIKSSVNLRRHCKVES
uniref:Uncharacterized protein n=1 Tax=Setaria italica TaxID=4555 RepID=K3Y3W3_SETIT